MCVHLLVVVWCIIRVVAELGETVMLPPPDAELGFFYMVEVPVALNATLAQLST